MDSTALACPTWVPIWLTAPGEIAWDFVIGFVALTELCPLPCFILISFLDLFHKKIVMLFIFSD